MAESDQQAKPLAPVVLNSRSDEEEASRITQQANFRLGKCIKCCGCFIAILLIITVTILILFFTVFHVKNPIIKINEITLLRLEPGNGLLGKNSTATLSVDVSVKNPNVASFKFNNGTTVIFHGDDKVGEAITPSGTAKARRTVHMNATVNLNPEMVLQVSSSGQLSVNSSTVIGGNVKIMNIIKKYLKVEVNCSISYSLLRKQIEHDCRPHFL